MDTGYVLHFTLLIIAGVPAADISSKCVSSMDGC